MDFIDLLRIDCCCVEQNKTNKKQDAIYKQENLSKTVTTVVLLAQTIDILMGVSFNISYHYQFVKFLVLKIIALL